MSRVVLPGALYGTVCAPPSKSQLHRLLILAALGENAVFLRTGELPQDVLATADCLRALGANIEYQDGGVSVCPIKNAPDRLCTLACRESGSTLRFLLPVCGTLGASAVFVREGRLQYRPLAPLKEQLSLHGMQLREDGALLYCSGTLQPGDYTLPGDISSQFISALLMALPRLSRESTLHITGDLESRDYVNLTMQTLRLAGIEISVQDGQYHIPGAKACRLPAEVDIAGDWSACAYWLCAGALSERGVCVTGLSPDSLQPDRAIVSILRQFGARIEWQNGKVFARRGGLHGVTIDAAQCPDLIPAVCAVAALSEGETRIVHAARLRLKESDRLHSTVQMLTALGAEAKELPDGLLILGKPVLSGGTVFPCGDHRIAMAAAIAAAGCENAVTVEQDACVGKSYPRFWDELMMLKGECK